MIKEFNCVYHETDTNAMSLFCPEIVKQTQQSLAKKEIAYFKLNKLLCVQYTHLVMYPFASRLPDVSSKPRKRLKGIAASYCGDYNQTATNSTPSKTKKKLLFTDVIRKKSKCVSGRGLYVTNELEYVRVHDLRKQCFKLHCLNVALCSIQNIVLDTPIYIALTCTICIKILLLELSKNIDLIMLQLTVTLLRFHTQQNESNFKKAKL